MAETLAQHLARIDREAAECDAYGEWCDARGYDPDADHWDEFREAGQAAYDDYLETLAESRAAS